MRKLVLCSIATLCVSVPLAQPALGAHKKKSTKCALYKEKAGCPIPADNGFSYTKGGSFRTRLSVYVSTTGKKAGGHSTGAALFVSGALPCAQPRTSRRNPKVTGKLTFGSTLKIKGSATVDTGTGPVTQTTTGTVKVSSAKTASLKLHITFKTGTTVSCDQKVAFRLKRFKQNLG